MELAVHKVTPVRGYSQQAYKPNNLQRYLGCHCGMNQRPYVKARGWTIKSNIAIARGFVLRTQGSELSCGGLVLNSGQ